MTGLSRRHVPPLESWFWRPGVTSCIQCQLRTCRLLYLGHGARADPTPICARLNAASHIVVSKQKVGPRM